VQEKGGWNAQLMMSSARDFVLNFFLHLLHYTALNQGKHESNRVNLDKEIGDLPTN
jgi:hypothetical protein